jgi:hypothetical protein
MCYIDGEKNKYSGLTVNVDEHFRDGAILLYSSKTVGNKRYSITVYKK